MQKYSRKIFFINYLKEIYDLFKDYINKIYFQYDGELSEMSQDEIEKTSCLGSSNINTLFGIKKNSLIIKYFGKKKKHA